jgi:anaerobic nitric oxide reductase transcription regulator
MESMTRGPFDLLLSMALDLNASLTAEDRHRRLVEAIRRVLPCDATVLFGLDGRTLVPLASYGLSSDAMGRRYERGEHPRLDVICSSTKPVVFPPDSPLPDPFDGMLATDRAALTHIHACLGCPLRVEDQLIGVLTVDALEPNAFDRFDKTFIAAIGALAGAALRTSQLIAAIQDQARRQGRIAGELQREQEQRHGGHLIGMAPAMKALREEITRYARSDVNVLITGETGTGKELVARALHASSGRSAQPLIYVNCAALPESVVESELFGHVRGAFTGASAARAGKFEIAEGGTLFLDEIGELPLSIQPKLLRAIQEGEIQRVGADELVHVDVRIVAATNRDLEKEVEAGSFRADLFHRLNVLRIFVPALGDRPEDVPLLAGYFCDVARRKLGLGPVRLHHDAHDWLRRARWPGNVRELENTILRAVLHASAAVARGEPVVVQPTDFDRHESPRPSPAKAEDATKAPAETAFGVDPSLSLRDAVDEFQRRLISAAVEAEGGNWAAAARKLGVHRANLHTLGKRLGLR